jgi:lipopolysaccharide export system permease protein
MKKIDKLVLDAFIGPFIITFLVVVFILLNIQMIRYFDDIIGKGLEWYLVAQLFFYFGVVTKPTALPLAVLLSALIAYGNLGEHFELTAIKGAGISLVRTIRPIFFFVLLLTAVAFYSNNYWVPKASLEAYSLLYDIKQKKPALDLREGTFYYGIPEISIKVTKKFEDGETLKDIIIYDHRKNDGNKDVIVADSGKMYTVLNERYLKLELFDGYNYTEGLGGERDMLGQKRNAKSETLSRSKFAKSQVVFDLSSFQLERTDKKWFQGNRMMRNMSEINTDLDSIRREVLKQRMAYFLYKPAMFTYFGKKDSVVMPPEVYRYKVWHDSATRAKYISDENIGVVKDSLKRINEATSEKRKTFPAQSKKLIKPELSKVKDSILTQSIVGVNAKKTDSSNFIVRDSIKKNSLAFLDSVFNVIPDKSTIQSAANNVRTVQNQMAGSNTELDRYKKEAIIFDIQWHKILASSAACIAMFLIGAPLGAIIKKGGLGVPFLVSVLFFIVYYVLTIQGEKFAKQEKVSVVAGVWMPDIILLMIGLFFLRQARIDARFFETDFYHVIWDKLKSRLKRRNVLQANTV